MFGQVKINYLLKKHIFLYKAFQISLAEVFSVFERYLFYSNRLLNYVQCTNTIFNLSTYGKYIFK